MVEKLCSSSNQIPIFGVNKHINTKNSKEKDEFNNFFNELQKNAELTNISNILNYLFAALFSQIDFQTEKVQIKNVNPNNTSLKDALLKIEELLDLLPNKQNICENINLKDFLEKITNQSTNQINNTELVDKILELIKNTDTFVDKDKLQFILQQNNFDFQFNSKKEPIPRIDNISFEITKDLEKVNFPDKSDKSDLKNATVKKDSIVTSKVADSVISLINTISHDNNKTPIDSFKRPVEITSDNLLAKIVEKFKVIYKNNTSELHVDLKPDFIGKLTIRIFSDNNGKIEAKIFTDNNYVKNLVESNLSQLKETLMDQGINITNLTVSMSNSAFYNDNKRNLDDYKRTNVKNSFAEENKEYENLYEIFISSGLNQVDFIA